MNNCTCCFVVLLLCPSAPRSESADPAAGGRDRRAHTETSRSRRRNAIQDCRRRISARLTGWRQWPTPSTAGCCCQASIVNAPDRRADEENRQACRRSGKGAGHETANAGENRETRVREDDEVIAVGHGVIELAPCDADDITRVVAGRIVAA